MATPPPASATLSELPTEIKARVAALVHEADINREAKELRRLRLPPPAEGQPPLPQPAKRPSDCGMLARTSREWSRLCSSHLFEVSWVTLSLAPNSAACCSRVRRPQTLEASRTQETFFKFNVLPRHAQRFKRLVFKKTASADTLIYALSLLPILENLTHISMKGERLKTLAKTLGPDVWSSAWMAAARVSSLTLGKVMPSLAMLLLGELPAVKRLIIKGTASFDATAPVARLPALLDALAARPWEHLSITPYDDWRHPQEITLSNIFSGRQWASSSTLQSLSVSARHLDSAELSSIAQFGPSLQSLSLRVAHGSVSPMELSDTPLFPHLVHLSLAGPIKILADILPAFVKSPVQHLDLNLALPSQNPLLWHDFLNLIFATNTWKGLRRMSVSLPLRPAEIPAAHMSFIKIQLQQAGVEFSVSPDPQGAFNIYAPTPGLEREERQAETKHLLHDVQATLDYTQALAGRVLATGDLEKARMMVMAMEGLFDLREEEQF